MSYTFKKKPLFINGKVVYEYILSEEAMPLYLGGSFFKPIKIDDVEEFTNTILSSNDATHITLNNLKQTDFDKVIKSLNNKIEVLEYCDLRKHDQVLDLKVLKLCKKLKKVDIQYSDKTIKLWNMKFNHKLDEVELKGIKKILNQKGLERASVSKLVIKRRTHLTNDTKELLIKDFSLFETMPNLKVLDLFIKKKKNKKDDLYALSKLKNIKEIHLPKNYFFFNQYAWLSSKLTNVKGIGCIYKIEYDHANEMDSYIINGSRMCWYIKENEKVKLNRYLKEFDKLVESYKNQIEPPLR